MIDRETAQRIKDAADIVDVVSDYVRLTRRGANFMGLCPFHNERTPSFSVNRAKNFCYCFSCKKGGSPVNFIMEKEGISYHDALLQLAAKYGIEVRERELTDEERARQNMRDAMFVANEWAMKEMEKNLRETDEGRDIGLQYFYQRGLTDEAIKAFRLGYAIDRGDSLTGAARRAGYDLELMHQLGLIGRSQQGDRMYDRFRGRVIFPVFTSSGKVVAFGGRTLKKDDKAKYINSPESEIYKKSNELYGLYQAKGAITREDKVFLVEGYMDVIGMWQSGMQNVVASSGTALTDGQIALIHRFTSKVTLLYDGDSAGIKAALRGINMLLEHSMDVSVLLLPEGHDPDSFARAHTPEEFRKYVQENETDIVRFKIRILLEHCRDNPQKRAAAIRSVVESIACIPDNITRNVYIGECARLFGVDENMIAVETRRAREGAVSRARQQRDRAKIQAMEQSAAAAQQQQPAGKVSSPQQPLQTSRQQMPVRLTPLQKRLLSCEKETLRYCVKYGRLDFSEGIDEDGNSVRLNVLDFVRCELEADGLSFSHAPYAEVFHRLEGLTEEFEEAYRQYAEEVDREIAEKRRQGFEEIGKEQLEMAELQSREKILENNLAAERERLLVDFVTLWPGRQLASDEDDNVRAIVTELITAKYHISRVYTEAGYVDDERTRLEELVARAVDEWKDTILEMRQNELRRKLTEAAESGDMEGVIALQKELVELTSLRSSVAKYIGDRVIVSR